MKTEGFASLVVGWAEISGVYLPGGARDRGGMPDTRSCPQRGSSWVAGQSCPGGAPPPWGLQQAGGTLVGAVSLAPFGGLRRDRSREVLFTSKS